MKIEMIWNERKEEEEKKRVWMEKGRKQLGCVLTVLTVCMYVCMYLCMVRMLPAFSKAF